MSDRAPDDAAKPRAKLPVQALPWIAVLAMAALWPKKKKTTHGAALAEPLLHTPADYEAAEPGRGRSAKFPWNIPALGWKDIFWRAYRETGRDRLPALAGGVTFPTVRPSRSRAGVATGSTVDSDPSRRISTCVEIT